MKLKEIGFKSLILFYFEWLRKNKMGELGLIEKNIYRGRKYKMIKEVFICKINKEVSYCVKFFIFIFIL